MSVNWLSSAWATEVGSPTRKAVLIALADRCGEEGICWPSYRDLMARTELSRSTVKEALGDLEVDGFIETWNRERPDGSNTSKGYRLVIPDISRGVGSRPGGVGSRLGGGSAADPRTEPSVEPSSDKTVRRRGATSQRRAEESPSAGGTKPKRRVYSDDETGGSDDEAPAYGGSRRKPTEEVKAVAEERGTSGYGLAMRLQRGLASQPGDRAIVDLKALAKRLNDRHRGGESREVQARMIETYAASPQRYSTGDYKGWTGFLAATPKLAADVEKHHLATADAAELYTDPYEGIA